MVFAVKAAKMAVSSRQIELDGAVALVHLCTCNSPFDHSCGSIKSTETVKSPFSCLMSSLPL